MQDFTFTNPATVHFGRNALDHLEHEVKSRATTVLLVYGGKSVKASGLYERIRQEIKRAGAQLYELAGVMPNPRLSLAREGIRLCREHKVELVLGVGGGSAIDTAKSVAAGACYDGDVWDFFTKKAVPERALPIGAILTLPAAGSEMSFNAMLVNEEKRIKRGYDSIHNVPKFSILNPELTFTLPPFQTACGCSDILAHLMERYFTRTEHVELVDRLLEGAMKTVIRNAPIALREPENYDARAEIMWTSSLAHNGLFSTGRTADWASHNIDRELGAAYDTTHGAGLAVIFPAWMQYVHRADSRKFVQFAQRVFDVDFAPDCGEEATVLEGIRRLESFYRSLELPASLTELGVGREKFEEMAQQAAPQDATIGKFLPLRAADIVKILELAL